MARQQYRSSSTVLLNGFRVYPENHERDGVIFGKGFHIVLWQASRVHGVCFCVSVFAYEHFKTGVMVSDFSSDFHL